MAVIVPVLVVTGTVGVGKTTTAIAISDILADRGMTHALIDMDWMRWSTPRPQDDPFNTAVGYRNLAAVWANYRAMGAEYLVLVDVVEDNADLDQYDKAVPDATIQVVRLLAPLPTILRRLEGRESDENLAWHQRRAPELIEIMDRNHIGDIQIETDGRSNQAIALDILHRIGWLDLED